MWCRHRHRLLPGRKIPRLFSAQRQITSATTSPSERQLLTEDGLFDNVADDAAGGIGFPPEC
jgi:hypothetical protein